jgi:RNA polymerase sigma-70 factor (ECF subfamily)
MDAEAELIGVYRTHLPLVRGRALRILGSPAAADDVTQEVFMRYLTYRRRGGHDPQNCAAFLYRMATHCALNSLRAASRRQKRETVEPLPAAPAAPEDVLAVRTVLARVPEELAQIAAYYFLDGLEHEEIAQLLNMQRRTVGRRLEAFKAKAREILGEGKLEAVRAV